MYNQQYWHELIHDYICAFNHHNTQQSTSSLVAGPLLGEMTIESRSMHTCWYAIVLISTKSAEVLIIYIYRPVHTIDPWDPTTSRCGPVPRVDNINNINIRF